MSNPASSSYGRILKTSALLGGSTIIGIAMGIIRTKVLAVRLGPEPYGIMGLYGGFIGIVAAVASLGVGTSAVREIAEATGKGDELEIAHTTVAIRRVVWVTGLLGMLVSLALAWPASYWTFGDGRHAWAFVALSLTVLLGQISGGQTALLNGLRRIREITFINMTGAVLSTLLAIPILLCLRERGIVPFMLAVSGGGLIVSWFYARRVRTSGVTQTWRETWIRSKQMVHLGVVLMLSGLVGTVATYLVRLIIQSQVGEKGVGLYQSAFMLSGTYVGFILGAMGADYYPRLAEVAQDREKANRLVNEQTDMALLMGVPGLVAAIVLADVVIWAFYSSRFAGATGILRWTVLGLFCRIVNWPVGFILLARADRRAFFWSELFAWSLLVGLTFMLVKYFGATGAGMAFAGMYGICTVIVYVLCRYRHGFRWQPGTAWLIACGGLLVMAAFASTLIRPRAWHYSIQFSIAGASVVFSVFGMYRCLGRERIWITWLKLRTRLGLVRVDAAQL